MIIHARPARVCTDHRLRTPDGIGGENGHECWYTELAAYWLTLDHIPDGEDVFAGEPVSGLDSEQLSAAVCDANLTMEE